MNIIPLEKLQYSIFPGPLSIVPIFSNKNTVIGKVTVKELSDMLFIKDRTKILDNSVKIKSTGSITFSLKSDDEYLTSCIISNNFEELTAVNNIFTVTTNDFSVLLLDKSNVDIIILSGDITEIDIFGDCFKSLTINAPTANIKFISVLDCPNLNSISCSDVDGLTIIARSGIYSKITGTITV